MGDLVLTSDNPYLIKAVGNNRKVITYEKSKAKEQKLNINTFASMDRFLSTYTVMYMYKHGELVNARCVI